MLVNLKYTSAFYRGDIAIIRTGVPVFAYLDKDVARVDEFGVTNVTQESTLVQLPYITLNKTPDIELPLVEENAEAINHLVNVAKTFRFSDSTSSMLWGQFKSALDGSKSQAKNEEVEKKTRSRKPAQEKQESNTLDSVEL